MPKKKRPLVATIEKGPSQKMDSKSNGFLIVGVGASAGGLEAFMELFRDLPPDTGMAFVLVQHLSPQHLSILSSLIQKSTRMLVNEIEDGMQVAPNHVYVIPPQCFT